jgi:hypothetical protein
MSLSIVGAGACWVSVQRESDETRHFAVIDILSPVSMTGERQSRRSTNFLDDGLSLTQTVIDKNVDDSVSQPSSSTN